MEVIKFENSTITGDQESAFRWTEIIDKEELLVEVFATEELFEDLSIYWRDLEKRADCKVYMSYDWAYNWWQHFGKNSQRSLFIITVWDGTRLVGLAPFYKGYSTFGNRTLETRLQLIGSGGSPNEQVGYLDDYGISDFLDIVVDQSYTEPVADYLADLLTSEFLDVDTVKFHQSGDDSFIIKDLYPRLERRIPEIQLEHIDTCPFIDLRPFDSLKAYIKEQKSNARRRLRQTIRAMDPDEEYLIEDATHSWEATEKAIENIIELHQSRWNRMGFPGVFYDERFTQFFKDTVEYAFKNGWLWFKEAVDEEGVCASRMILKYNNRYYDYISGFDDLRPSSKYRPGIGLLIDLIQEGLSNNVSTVELLRGEEGYKYDFTSDNFKNWRITMPIRKRRLSIPQLLNRMGAYFYKYFIRETRLLKVQHRQKGFIKMWPGYISFRWMSVKLKFRS